MIASRLFKFLPFYLLSFIPLPILYVLADFFYFIIYYVIGYRKKVVRKNLRAAFKNSSEQEIQRIEKAFYHHFCDIMVEALKTLSISERNFQKRFKLKNPELLQHLYDDNKSIILYAAHLGNWEWLSIFPTLTHYQVISFYQPLSNRYFDDLMKTIRQRFGVVCVESKKGFKTLLQYRAKGIQTICFVIGDQSPAGNSTKHWTNFFNTDTAFLIGAETIAKKSDQVLVFPSFNSPRKGYYEVELIVIEKDESDEKRFALTDAYAKILEESIKKSPELWLWSHKRWKLRREENK